jgi:hypothetical protein
VFVKAPANVAARYCALRCQPARTSCQ